MSSAPIGTIHHVELWVPDIDRAAAQWGWLLTELGYQPFQEWTGGCSWRLADTYIVIEQSPDMLAEPHDRKRPGLNHLAFHAGDQAQVDALTAAAAENGWALMFADKHPHAGGPQTYAAYLSNTDGHEVELTASNPVELTHPQVLTIPPACARRSLALARLVARGSPLTGHHDARAFYVLSSTKYWCADAPRDSGVSKPAIPPDVFTAEVRTRPNTREQHS